MKLQEIQARKELQRLKSQDKTVGAHLAEILRKHGWHLLGYGAEAGVAEHPDRKYVLKLFPKNSLYTHWVELCNTQLKGNPHVPRLGTHVRTIPGTEFSYVRMEKLSPMEEFDLVHTWPQVLCLLSTQRKLPLKISSIIHNNVSWSSDTHLINCNQLQITAAEHQVFDQLSHMVQQLGDHTLDLKASNFMSRGREWVLTDPII